MDDVKPGDAFRCTGAFSVLHYEDLEHMENMFSSGSFEVAEGAVYTYEGPGYESDAHLEGDDGWLEVSWETLRERFAPLGAGRGE